MDIAEFLSYSTLFLGLFAFLAGFIDAIVGGGGLVQLPALFVAFPTAEPATLLGTNKMSAIGGTLVAAKKFLRSVKIPKAVFLVGGIFALCGSFLGAWLVTQISAHFLRGVLPPLLVALLAFTLLNKNMGLDHQVFSGTKKQYAKLIAGTGLIGLYDGFFGPGTGMFLMFLFVHFLKFDFIHAAASTKVINCITNFAALVLFIPTGYINWPIAFWMMSFNMVGGFAGSSLAISRGSQLVRKVFILVVVLLILKTSNDAYGWAKLIHF